jgi:hypothetical protein
VTVHCRTSTEAPRSARIVLSAVDTTRRSSATINDATDVRTRTHLCADLELMSPSDF